MLFQKIYPEITNILEIGSKSGGLNMESLIKAGTQFLVLFPGHEGEKLSNEIKKFGIKPFILDVENLEGLKKSIVDLSVLLKVEKQGLIVKNEMERILKIVDSNLKNNPPNKKIKAYFASSRNIFTTNSNKLLQHEMLLKAGCEDVVKINQGGWLNISVEQLLIWNPDIIFISQNNNYNVEDVFKDERISQLNAVKNKKVFTIPDELSAWDFPCAESVLGVLWISKTCYPDIYENINFENEKNRFYFTIYGRNYSDLIKK